MASSVAHKDLRFCRIDAELFGRSITQLGQGAFQFLFASLDSRIAFLTAALYEGVALGLIGWKSGHAGSLHFA
jgi:hypothetical protein